MSIVNRCGINRKNAFRAKEARNGIPRLAVANFCLTDAPGMAHINCRRRPTRPACLVSGFVLAHDLGADATAL